MRAHLSNRDFEQISAYLDGQLSSRDRARLEERMRTDPAIQQALDEMARTRSLLRMAAKKRAPRNFTLTPAMVGSQQQPQRGFFNLFPVLSFASVVATLALVFSFLFQFSPYFQTGTASLPAASAPAAAPAPGEDSLLAPKQAAPEGQPDAGDVNALNAPQATSAPAIGGGVESAAPEIPLPVVNAVPRAWGMGGGGDGGAQGTMGVQSPQNESGVMNPQLDAAKQGPTYGMPLVIPPDSAANLEGSAAPAASSGAENPEARELSQPIFEGNGPILGVPKAGETGRYLNELPTPMPTPTRRPVEEPTQPAASEAPAPESQVTETAPSAVPGMVFIQVLLGIIALTTGAAAYIAWRRAH